MELRQIRYMVGVCEAGSLLAASKTLHVAQPALSQHIAALEHELGTRLFVRTSRGMTLTDAGHAFREHARVVLADVERAKAAVRPSLDEIRGDVVVGLSTSVSLVATLPIVQETRRLHPAIRLKVVEGHGVYLADWLQGGRLDIALLYTASSQSMFDQRPLLEERLAFVTRPVSGTASPRETTLRRVAREQLIMPGRDHALRRLLDDACRQARLALDVVVEIDSLHTIKSAVEQGIASAVLSPGSVSHEVAAGQLAMSLIRNPRLARRLVCATSLTRPNTPATLAVRAVVEAALKGLVTRGTWPATWIGG